MRVRDLQEVLAKFTNGQKGSVISDCHIYIESLGENASTFICSSPMVIGDGSINEEAGLDLIPGLGELVMAGTLIGGLVKGEKEAKEQREETPGPPPTQAPPPPTPQMAFDAAPSLNTATYHQY